MLRAHDWACVLKYSMGSSQACWSIVRPRVGDCIVMRTVPTSCPVYLVGNEHEAGGADPSFYRKGAAPTGFFPR